MFVFKTSKGEAAVLLLSLPASNRATFWPRFPRNEVQIWRSSSMPNVYLYCESRKTLYAGSVQINPDFNTRLNNLNRDELQIIALFVGFNFADCRGDKGKSGRTRGCFNQFSK
jgi:hypothetical protein